MGDLILKIERNIEGVVVAVCEDRNGNQCAWKPSAELLNTIEKEFDERSVITEQMDESKRKLVKVIVYAQQVLHHSSQ